VVTKIEVQRARSAAVDTHIVEGDPRGLSDLVNEALGTGKKFVTFNVPGDKMLSVVAERVEAIWQE
jgi:hypothetical protein